MFLIGAIIFIGWLINQMLFDIIYSEKYFELSVLSNIMKIIYTIGIAIPYMFIFICIIESIRTFWDN